MRSTGTSDLREARIYRDKVVAEFFEIREQMRPQKQGRKIDLVLDELKQLKQHVSHQNFTNVIAKSCPSLAELRDEFLLQFTEKRKLSTLSKYIKSVEVFTGYFRKKDFRLYEINRTMVTAWLDHQKKEKASQTLANYLGCLSQLVEFARNRYHDAPGDNPFKGHNLDVRCERESYQPFTLNELAKVFSAMDGDDEMQAVTLIGMHSGMRLNEICSLQVGNIRKIEGVLCFEVLEGKTKSAARVIPVHSRIIDLVESLRQKPYNGFLFYHASITDRADGKRSTWHTQRFTKAKRAALGMKGTEYKVFHSLRGMFISQLDRAGIPEDRIALLAGHERGNTESFKTYSKKSASPVELSKYVELISYDTGA
jgi:integrase